MRSATISRKTAETAIDVTVNLDGTGIYDVSTGIGFLDHMIEQLSRHSLIDITLKVDGDLHVDQHHTTEDSARWRWARPCRRRWAIARASPATAYATAPMDETLSRAAIDISGRPFLAWKSGFSQEKLGELDTELIEHWFHSFTGEVGMTLHLETLYGKNNHHICESLFKALARALRQAVEIDPRKADAIPSTKGTLGGPGADRMSAGADRLWRGQSPLGGECAAGRRRQQRDRHRRSRRGRVGRADRAARRRRLRRLHGGALRDPRHGRCAQRGASSTRPIPSSACAWACS
jgi:imidazoleglycerol-phosphate dehydratase